jgi:3-hydroxybutyryl-CoA dehydratase
MIKKGDKYSVPFMVTPAIYNGFTEIFGDKNPLHTETGFAHSAGFKDRVMHGNILNGFLSYFIGECLPLKNVIIQSQQIEFKEPVYLNDKLELQAEADDIHNSVNVVVFKFIFTNQSSQIIAKGKIQIGVL